MNLKRCPIVLMLLLFAAACQSTERTPGEEEVIETTGVVQYVDLEGGFYGIVAEDGTRYDPTNLPAEFREDNVRVHFRARPREDAVGIHMWGTMVEILEIHPLE